jgi:hypothetical protein
MKSIFVCLVLKAIHLTYSVVSYGVLPYALTSSKPWQWVSLVNMIVLALHWKLLGNRCIIDILEKMYCPTFLEKRLKSRVGENVTFTNIQQMLWLSTVFIALNTVAFNAPLTLPVRATLAAVTAAAAVVVPIADVYACKTRITY